MKKILYVTTISGFLPQFELRDVRIVEEMGYEVHYASNFNNPIYSFDKDELEKQGIVLHHIDVEKSPVHLRHNYKAFRQLKKIIDEENIDVVHCHNPMGGVIGRLSSALSRRKPYVIYTAHGFHFYKGASALNWILFYPVERFLAGFTNEIITINKEDYLRASKFRLRKRGSVTQIHGVGVDTERFRAIPGAYHEKRIELGIPENAFHIVTAAELNDNKNQVVILEALAKLNDSDIYYSICGKGPREKMLSELIKEFHLEDRVKLLGYRTDMEYVLQSADAFAFPSIREGLGIAAVEALFCEVPLIASDNRGTREYAFDGLNSIVCKENDMTSFAEAIERLKGNSAYRYMLKANSSRSVGQFSAEETEKVMRLVYARANQGS